MQRKYDAFHLFLSFLSGVVLLFVIAPLVGMFLQVSPKQLVSTLCDIAIKRSIWLTLWTSMLATLFLSIGAIPLSYILARKNFPLKNLLNGIIDLPIVIPHSAAGIAMLSIIAKTSITEKFNIPFVDSPLGIMTAMAFVSLPFLINSARDGFAMVDERLEKIALNLGASPARVFFTVSIPLAWRAIVSGLVLMWARGMSEFGAVIVIAYNPMIMPVMIYDQFISFGLSYAIPIAVLFLIVCLIFFAIFRSVAYGERDAKNR